MPFLTDILWQAEIFQVRLWSVPLEALWEVSLGLKGAVRFWAGLPQTSLLELYHRVGEGWKWTMATSSQETGSGRENCSDDLGPRRQMAKHLHSGACLESAPHLFCPGDAQSGLDAVPGAARQAPSAPGLALALPRWPHVCGRSQAATPSPWGLLFRRAESFLLRTL